ncbi:hypothetical protein TIFTF001_005715 [Ficus carica]|uniref:Uncharacterized protein n=1 Tax=Ficus carica TaxID=3494 RepID=A0AA87ZPF8_FICCA|nr:hypothetical protein TIFTF001_005715 [Ficus carica]
MAEVAVFGQRIDDRHLLSAVRFECQRSSPVVASITHLHRSGEKGGLRRAHEFSINWFQDEPESPTAHFASSPASTTSRAARPWVAQMRRMADFQIWSKSVAHRGSPFGLPHAVAAVGNSPPYVPSPSSCPISYRRRSWHMSTFNLRAVENAVAVAVATVVSSGSLRQP